MDTKKNTNKEFVFEMISNKKTLDDYPDRISDSMVVYEPASLPFGGTYKGYNAFKQFYPIVRDFYDFTKFHVENIYGDENAVFVIINATIAKSGEPIKLCEKFLFNEKGQIAEVMLFIYDYDNKPIHRILN